MEKIKNHVRFLLDNGILFEINRKVLHPLGLVLVVDVDPENDNQLVFDGLYSLSDDIEGILFDSETFEEGQRRYQEFLIRDDGQKRLDAREKKLGYIVQEKSTDA